MRSATHRSEAPVAFPHHGRPVGDDGAAPVGSLVSLSWLDDVVLELWVDEHPGRVTVTLAGSFTATTSEPVRALLDGLIAVGHTAVAVDATEVDVTDDAARRVLADAEERLRRVGGRLVVREPASSVGSS